MILSEYRNGRSARAFVIEVSVAQIIVAAPGTAEENTYRFIICNGAQSVYITDPAAVIFFIGSDQQFRYSVTAQIRHQITYTAKQIFIPGIHNLLRQAA